MTVAARIVLEDCRKAYADLVEGIQGSEWRCKWTTVVTLLRVVLHVLDKVDGGSDPKVRSAVDGAWGELNRTKPLPEIFWRFIEEDRNLILKQYAHRAGQKRYHPLGCRRENYVPHERRSVRWTRPTRSCCEGYRLAQRLLRRH